MPLASSPALAYIAAGLSWSMNTSGSTMHRTFSAAVEDAVLGQRLQHLRAEAADRALLDRDEDLVLAGEPQHQIGVERLGEARVGHRGGQAVRGERLGRLAGIPASRVPNDSSATEVPSRMIRPLPISSGTPTSGMSTPTPSPRG